MYRRPDGGSFSFGASISPVASSCDGSCAGVSGIAYPPAGGRADQPGIARGAWAQFTDVEPLLVRCATLARTFGDAHLVAMDLGNLAVVAPARGDGDRAATLFEEPVRYALNGRVAGGT